MFYLFCLIHPKPKCEDTLCSHLALSHKANHPSFKTRWWFYIKICFMQPGIFSLAAGQTDNPEWSLSWCTWTGPNELSNNKQSSPCRLSQSRPAAASVLGNMRSEQNGIWKRMLCCMDWCLPSCVCCFPDCLNKKLYTEFMLCYVKNQHRIMTVRPIPFTYITNLLKV